MNYLVTSPFILRYVFFGRGEIFEVGRLISIINVIVDN